MAALRQSSSLAGTQLASRPAAVRRPGRSTRSTTVASTKKVNTVDDGWSKGFFTSGYLLEDKEKAPVNILRNVEKKKLLSQAGKLGLLSGAEKAGITLSKLESWKLLSTAENLGLLSLAENALVADPGTVSSSSIPFFVLALLSLIFIPQDNIAEQILRFTAFGGFFAVFTALFIGGFVIKGLQDEE